MPLASPTPLPDTVEQVDGLLRESVEASVMGRLEIGVAEIDVRLEPEAFTGAAEWRCDPFGFHLKWVPGATTISIRFERFLVEELRSDDSLSWIRAFGPGELRRAAIVACDILVGCAIQTPRLIHPALLAAGRCGTCHAEDVFRSQAAPDSRHARLQAAGVPEVISCWACGTHWMGPHRDDPDRCRSDGPAVPSPVGGPHEPEDRRPIERRSWGWTPP